MKYIILVLMCCVLFGCNEKGDDLKDMEEIRQILDNQQKSWSDGDIEGFMSGYWKNDSLKFYSGSKLSKGWQNTLDNYKLRYPTKSHTGN